MIWTALESLVCGDAGQDLIEYGLLASLIAVTVVGAVMALGGAINTYWQYISTQVPNGS